MVERDAWDSVESCAHERSLHVSSEGEGQAKPGSRSSQKIPLEVNERIFTHDMVAAGGTKRADLDFSRQLASSM